MKENYFISCKEIFIKKLGRLHISVEYVSSISNSTVFCLKNLPYFVYSFCPNKKEIKSITKIDNNLFRMNILGHTLYFDKVKFY